MRQSFVRERETAAQENIPKPTQEKACIMASTREIYQMQNRRGDYSSLNCTSYFKCSKCQTWCYKGKCSVACGHWRLLRLTSEEQSDLRSNEKTASINLLEHLSELIPGHSNGKVGLVTYQNGINNKYEDHFADMGEWIKSNLEEGVLCIGLYNQSWSIAVDLFRLQCEFLGIRTEVVRSMRKMFTTVANRLNKIRPRPHWLHIAHSEGGRIVHDALSGLPFEAKVFCQNHLLVDTYGSIQPVSERTAKMALNTYSRDDIAYKQYGTQCENCNGYKINVVDSLKKPALPIPGDHGFLSATYQNALIQNIKEIRRFPGIYDAKS